MKIKEVVETLERFAPLPLQESYDNAGLQIGLTEREASGVLVCLDVTEPVLLEAKARGGNVVVSHHPLLFRGVKTLADATQVERCVRLAVELGIAVYSAHTNLDNAPGGVNHEIARRLGLEDVRFLQPLPGGGGGSGIVGRLSRAEQPMDFLRRVKQTFGCRCLMHNEGPQREVRTVAVCGGAGDFLVDRAIALGADAFITGEMHYHCYFGHESQLWLAVLGHYESERFTIDLLGRILAEAHPALPVVATAIDTNPVKYL